MKLEVKRSLTRGDQSGGGDVSGGDKGSSTKPNDVRQMMQGVRARRVGYKH